MKNVLDIRNKKLKVFPTNRLFKNTVIIAGGGNNFETFPKELLIHSEITHIDLGRNKITSIPDQINKLENLIELHLSSNQLKDIPATFKNLEKLSFLDLNDNLLPLVFNPHLFPKSLSILSLGYNQFEEIPKSINHLSNLIHLDLGVNYISKIPKEIGDLTKLVSLRLDGNKITKLPKEIGNLRNLSTLDLCDNNLTHLPKEIKNLKNLKKLELAGNKLLPNTDHISENEPQKLIDYILKNQVLPPDVIRINKVFILNNVQLPHLKEESAQAFTTVFEEQEKEYELIDQIDQITKNISILFVIAAYDVHENSRLLQKVLEKAKKYQIPYFVFMPEAGTIKDVDMNLMKMESVLKTRKYIEANHRTQMRGYRSLSNLTGQMFGLMKDYHSKIQIKQLKLHNIGHFDNLEISFSERLTCLVGENGTGKSTILRAIALALIGSDHDKIKVEKVKDLLRIQGLKDNLEIRESGKIELEFELDGETITNTINLMPVDNGRAVKAIFQSSGSNLLSGSYNLKTLVIGFPQVHRTIDASISAPLEPLQEAHIEDLIPLINNVDDNRLLHFSDWLANLNNDALNATTDHAKNRAQQIINQTFRIISKIIGYKVQFQQVKSITPLEIWIRTPNSPHGIPLRLLSQGFKEVIGWIGYLIQRLADAYAGTSDFTKENGIVFLDEIDRFTHPKWQIKLINVLKETFINIQFIISSHSPLAILDQDVNEIQELYFEDNKAQLKSSPRESVDKINVNSTVLNYFDLPRVLQKKWQEKVDYYNTLKHSETALGEIEKQELESLENELNDALIGLPMHDYRYFLFLKFLKEKGIDPKKTATKIEMSEEEFTAYKQAYAEYL